MVYTLENCSLYELREINNIPVIIFENHNMALPVWGSYAYKLKKSLSLLTFDTHADTHDPFAREVGGHEYKYKQFKKEVLSKIHYSIYDFEFEDVYKLACEYVVNDEHILCAYLFDYINEYNIFCDLSEEDIAYYQNGDTSRGLNAAYYSKYSILTMPNDEIKKFCEKPFILDFDLDYFTSSKIFTKNFIDKISLLIRSATLITIAKEPFFFNDKVIEKNFTNQEALDMLLKIIENAING